MRRPFALLICLLAIAPIAEAATKPAAKPVAKEAPAVIEQQRKVDRLAKTHLAPAFPEALVELARRYRTAGQLKPARDTMVAAAEAFDKQVELHKSLSEVVTTFELARSERTVARKLAMQRDEAFFMAAEYAREWGDTDSAIRHYVTVVQSQPDQPLGEQALAALTRLGFVVPPPPAASAAPTRSPEP